MSIDSLKQLWPLSKDAFSDWSEDKATKLAAALAYYTMLSIAPLLIISIKIIGKIFGDEAARGQIAAYLNQTVGAKGAESAQEIIKHASQPGSGVFATVISIIVLLFSASGVFGELQDSLNTIWEVKPRPGRGIFGIIKDRFFSITLVLGVVFLLLVSLIASTALAGMSHAIGLEGGWLLGVLNFVLSLAVITLLFALIFKYLPDAQVRWRDVWIGAIFTAMLFTIGKTLLGWYLGRGSTTNVYGAAGSLVALLIWVYYSAQIMFFGAEFTQVYAKRFGRGILPTENAVPMTEQDRAAEGKPHAAPRLATPLPVTMRSPESDTKMKITAAASLAAGAALGAVVVASVRKHPLRGHDVDGKVEDRLRRLRAMADAAR